MLNSIKVEVFFIYLVNFKICKVKSAKSLMLAEMLVNQKLLNFVVIKSNFMNKKHTRLPVSTCVYAKLLV